MSTWNRKLKIVDILITQRSTTVKELARSLDVSVRTIHNDILELSVRYPIYTKQGEHGGVFIKEEYRPYNNTLSKEELNLLCELCEIVEEAGKKILLQQIIRKYGPIDFEM